MSLTALQGYETQGSSIITHAEHIMIVDDTTRELAAEFTTKARQAIKAIKAEFGSDIASAHKLHKDLLARQKKLIAPFEAARVIVDREISRDYLEREGARQEEERKVWERAIAVKAAQDDALAAEAQKLIEDERFEDAEALVDTEIVVAPILPVADVQKTMTSTTGSATVRKDIKVEVVDKVAVIEAVVKRVLPFGLISVDMAAAKKYAKCSGLDDIPEMPGFRVTETAIVSGRVR